jgi:hypothetical protein
MTLRDYSNGANPELANLINRINDQEAQRANAHREHVRSMERVGFAFIVGTLIQKYLESRKSCPSINP